MKIIDLLNRIANGEEVPKKFIVDGDTLYIGEDKFIEYADGKQIEWFIYPGWLNEEVEILEEKKIPEKLNLDKEELRGKETPRAIDYLIEGKINEVIDYLKSKGDE